MNDIQKGKPEKLVVYTDGSVLNNGSADAKGGWAFKIILDGETISTKSDSAMGKTNNQMEMLAVLMAMRAIGDKATPVEIHSDSSYVVETINGSYKINRNKNLWQELFREKEKFADIKFLWVRGHSKNEHNRDVDREAKRRAREAAIWQ